VRKRRELEKMGIRKQDTRSGIGAEGAEEARRLKASGVVAIKNIGRRDGV